MCPGCYNNTVDTYCRSCRKLLFDGKQISHFLDFARPTATNLHMYQEQTKRLSISGAQLKYSLCLKDDKLELTETAGGFILKPIPVSQAIIQHTLAPENEHLTMQIARKVFRLNTAANALIYFKDGTPAYITRRFDIAPDGDKYLQEDMAQISGRTRQTAGENFKYQGTYEEIGQLIQRYVAASPVVMEQYFKLVLFNYLFSNGDAHMKNFSLMRTEAGDYMLTPAYDLMSTVIHTPLESDTALDLFNGDLNTSYYNTYGYHGQANFRELAARLGINQRRANRIITEMLSRTDGVLNMIDESFLDDAAKILYRKAYTEKLLRMGMTGQMIANAIELRNMNVYAYPSKLVKLHLIEKQQYRGYFQRRPESEDLAKSNKYTFVSFDDALQIVIDGDLLVEVVAGE